MNVKKVKLKKVLEHRMTERRKYSMSKRLNVKHERQKGQLKKGF